MKTISSHMVSRNGLYFWGNAEATTVTPGVSASCTDLGGSGRTMSASGPVPSRGLHSGANNQYALYFNGASTVPMIHNPGAKNIIKHWVAIASYDAGTFSAQSGLLGGISSGGGDPVVLTGESGQTRFLAPNVSSIYRKANQQFAYNAAAAPMSGQPRVVELSLTSGFNVDGVQIGRDRDFGYHWTGYIFEWAAYDRVLSEAEVRRWHLYAARKYNIWETYGGVDVFPAVCDWGSPRVRRKRVLADVMEPQSTIYRLKKDSKYKWDLKFSSRLYDEVDAIRSFYHAKGPNNQFVYRDLTVYPAIHKTVQFSRDAAVNVRPQGYTQNTVAVNIEEV